MSASGFNAAVRSRSTNAIVSMPERVGTDDWIRPHLAAANGNHLHCRLKQPKGGNAWGGISDCHVHDNQFAGEPKSISSTVPRATGPRQRQGISQMILSNLLS